MTYTPYLIANYGTGLDKSSEPWLIPNDAQQELLDGFVYKGVINKRDGYVPFASGQKGIAPYTESRLVNRIVAERTGTTNTGVAINYTTANNPLRRGTVTMSDGVELHTDNGLGAFPTAAAGTVNYTTGQISGFTFNAASGNPVVVTYDYHPGLPVMGIMNFVTATNVKQLLVADTKRVNLYIPATNTFAYVGHTVPIAGITNANPGVVTTTVAHNLLTNDRVFIYGVQGMTQINNVEASIVYVDATHFQVNIDTTLFGVWTAGGTVQLIYSGTNKNFWSWVNYADKDGNPRLIYTNNKDEVQFYAPHLDPTNPPGPLAFGDYMNYPTAAAVQFFMNDDAGVAVTSLLALMVFEFKDRLIMLRTTESGVVKPRRIRISGTGVNSDDFRTSATGAGFIDIPDGTWIQGACFNRDDLIIFTEASTWILKYTGNDTTPFELAKIDESRGSQAAFSAITYLNRSTAASPRGLIISDGYRVERADEKIPEFSFNEVDGDDFDLCFAGVVDEDRDHYLLYPTIGQQTNVKSQRILVTNYEEDNYAIYRLPLSCMGQFQQAFEITWADLSVYNNWTEFSDVYSNWNQFGYSSGAPFSLGGGHKGEVWRLNQVEAEDNPQKIRNITKISDTILEVTTDWNNYSENLLDPAMGNDMIFFTGVGGTLALNNKQYPITTIINEYTFRIEVPSGTYTSYTSGGVAQRVIPFSALFKKFNPYAGFDKKVRCGWLYMYVSTTGTSLTTNIQMSGATKSDPCVITTTTQHGYKTGQQVNVFGVGGMVELNDRQFYITVLTPFTFSLNGIDSSAYTAYTSGGTVSTFDKCKMSIDIFVNDIDEKTQLTAPDPYQGSCTNLTFEEGSKKWYKVYINQVGRFIQFRLRNQQAGAKIHIQATMPGFQPVGRMI